tara:strand:- start:144 stop:839 length:696 start_codon:yes stop_codon:yes gene_type:complete
MTSVLNTTSNMFAQVRKNKKIEIESRIGKIIDGKFVNGVEQEFFEEVYNEVKNCPDIVSDDKWSEQMDVFFKYNKNSYRTRVTYPNTSMMINTKTIKKTKLETYDVETDNEYQFRISSSLEDDVDSSTIPTLVNPYFVRLKHISHHYLNNNDWCITFTKTWGANSRTEVEQKQHNEIPCYEIECEFIGCNGTYLQEKTDVYAAESFLMKTLDVIGFPDMKYWINDKKNKQS